MPVAEEGNQSEKAVHTADSSYHGLAEKAKL